MLDDHDELIGALTRRVLAASGEEADAAALRQGRLLLVAALARLFDAQRAPAPAACLGPLLPGATLVGGARVPGSSLELEPSQAAWCVAWLSADACIGALLQISCASDACTSSLR